MFQYFETDLLSGCDADKTFRVQAQSDKRKKGLETAQQYYQFLQDTEEEDRWVGEKIDAVRSPSLGKDLNAALMMLKKHEVSCLSLIKRRLLGTSAY